LLIAVKLLFAMLDRRDDTSRPRAAPSRAEGNGPATTEPARAKRGAVPHMEAGIAALLPAARSAREGLSRDGCPLTRDALAVRLRQNGHHFRNSSLTPLLHALRSETVVPSSARDEALVAAASPESESIPSTG
jgi:hypothetical protein